MSGGLGSSGLQVKLMHTCSTQGMLPIGGLIKQRDTNPSKEGNDPTARRHETVSSGVQISLPAKVPCQKLYLLGHLTVKFVHYINCIIILTVSCVNVTDEPRVYI